MTGMAIPSYHYLASKPNYSTRLLTGTLQEGCPHTSTKNSNTHFIDTRIPFNFQQYSGTHGSNKSISDHTSIECTSHSSSVMQPIVAQAAPAI